MFEGKCLPPIWKHMRSCEIYNAYVMTGVFIILRKKDVNSKLTKKHVKLALANNKLLTAADKIFHS